MKDLSITTLYDCYSKILSDKQRIVFELYYEEDLSLSEIAEHTGTTRQGVRDLLKRSEEQLKMLEDGLKLNEKYSMLRNLAQKADDQMKNEIENIISY